MGCYSGQAERAKGKKRRRSPFAFGSLLLCCCVLLWQVSCQEQAEVAEATTLQEDTSVVAQGTSEAEVITPDLASGKKGEVAPEVARVAESQPGKPGPKITFEKVVHDFGEVGPGTKTIGEFKFANTGDGLLKITRVKECCGFSTRLSKREYAPGETGTLIAEYHAGPRAGVMRRQIVVYSNDRARPEVELTVKATIVERVGYEPKRLKLLLKDENAGCPSITLSSLDNRPFSIKGFKSTGNCITAEFDSSVEATKFVLKPKVDLARLQRSMNGLINVSLTHPDCGQITITYNALARFRVNPPQIIVLNAEPRKSIVRKVWVLNNYGEDFEVEGASSNNNSVKVLSRKKVKNGYEFELEITPPASKDEQKTFTDIFSVNIKGGEKLAITCRGFYSRKKE